MSDEKVKLAPKFCEDCAHCRPLGWWIFKSYEFARCALAVRDPNSLVSATLTDNLGYCSVERQFSCGPEAKKFVPKGGESAVPSREEK